MSRKSCFLLGLMSLCGIMLTGCQSGSMDQEKVEKIEKVVVKQAVKSAIRHSPVAVVKAVAK